MSAVKFINELPVSLQHQEGYRRVIEASHAGQNPVLDLAMWEKACVGVGEGNLLRDLSMPEKFTLADMDKVMSIRSQSFAKQKDKMVGKGSLTGEKVYDETFLSTHNVSLSPNTELVGNCSRPGVQLPNNHPMYKVVMSGLTGIASHYLTSTSISYLGERLTVRQDLRHLFLKGYLMVMSFNLATVSKVTKLRFNRLRAKVCYNVTPRDRMHLIVSKKIVVDAKMFTPTEVWMLAEMAGKYPNRRYGERNIYNSIFMEEDELYFFTDKSPGSVICDTGAGSPERLWNTLLSLAIKLDALDDLKIVISEFRGMPGMLRSLKDWTDKDDFCLEYPLSYSIILALDGALEKKPTIQKHSNYFATSKCLVADLLLSKMMEMSVFNLIEEAGALGSIGCPSGAPSADPFLDCIFRQFGLKLDQEGDNMLLDEWRAITSTSTPVMFVGYLRKLALLMAAAIKRGEAGFLRPQLLHALPYSRCKNTTWSAVRGWKFQSFNFEDDRDKRINNNQMTKGYTWVMGVSDDVPKIGLNAAGQQLLERLSLEEMKFTQCASGEYEIGLVRHILNVEVEPRTDEMELDADCFYMSNYPGTRCTLAYDKSGLPRTVVDSRASVNEIRNTLGVSNPIGRNRHGPPEVRVASFGGGSAHLRRGNSGPNDMEYLLLGKENGSPTPHNEGTQVSNNSGSHGGRSYPGRPSTGGGQNRNSGTANRTRMGGNSNYRRVENTLPMPSNVHQQSERSEPDVVRGNTLEPLAPSTDTSEMAEGLGLGNENVESEALVLSAGALKLNLNPPLITVGGAAEGVRAIKVDGEEVNIVAGPQKELVDENAMRGHLLKTVGDGRCGIHAILQDLRVRRMIDADNVDTALENILPQLVSTSDHLYGELAAVCNNLNMGLVIINEEAKRLLNYGDVGAEHIIYVKHRGNHYETFIPDVNGRDIFNDMTYFEEHTSPQQLVDSWKTIFKMWRNDRIEKELADQLSRRGNGSRNNWRSGGPARQ